MLVVLEGTLDVHAEEDFYPMKQGDVLLIGSSQLHRDRSQGILAGIDSGGGREPRSQHQLLFCEIFQEDTRNVISGIGQLQEDQVRGADAADRRHQRGAGCGDGPSGKAKKRGERLSASCP